MGMSDAAAASAWPLIEAEMMGIPTHGLIRVPSYAQRLRFGGINPKASIRLDRRAPSLALIDGGNAVGTAVATRVLDATFEIVAEIGLAYVGCRHSNHCGALIPYALKACEAGYLLLAGTNASTTMPPWGGGEARIGNNPFCVAAPIEEGEHFLLDMAMSVAARGKIRAARAAGQQIPMSRAVDHEGFSRHLAVDASNDVHPDSRYLCSFEFPIPAPIDEILRAKYNFLIKGITIEPQSQTRADEIV